MQDRVKPKIVRIFVACIWFNLDKSCIKKICDLVFLFRCYKMQIIVLKQTLVHERKTNSLHIP